MDDRSAKAALIIAAEPADGAGGLRATLPFLGATLVEHQVRQAIAAGARHVVVLVATMPPELLAALDRLRRDDVAIEVARNLADAADRIHPEEAVLLIGDGCLADQASVVRVASAAAPSLLVRPAGSDPAFERIDAAHGWGGLALVDGALVRRTASAPGEWDAQSTLLRRAVQAQAARIDAGESPPALLPRDAGRGAVAPALLAASRARNGSWARRWLFPVIDTPVVRLIGHRAVAPLWIALAAALLGLGAAGLAALAMPGPALAAFLLSGPAIAIGRRLARLRLGRLRHARLLEIMRAAGGAAALGITALWLPEWGWGLTAAITAAALAAAAREKAMLSRRAIDVPAAAADLDAIAWAALAGWLALGWPAAIAATAVYAASSFALVQERLLRSL